jgi:hypothetical protein
VPGAQIRCLLLYQRERSEVPFNCRERISRTDCSKYYRIYHTCKEYLRESTGHPNSTPAVRLYEPCVARLHHGFRTVRTWVHGFTAHLPWHYSNPHFAHTVYCDVFRIIIAINSDHCEFFTKYKAMPYVEVVYVRIQALTSLTKQSFLSHTFPEKSARLHPVFTPLDFATIFFFVQSYWACFGLYPSSCMWKTCSF